MSTRNLSLIIIVAVILLFGGCACSGYNGLVAKDENVKNKWANVQSDYQRRSDLIPNLVNTVKGYAAQEQRVLVEVTEARASATQVKVDASTITNPAQFQAYQQAQDKLSGVLGRLMMIQERYPDLKSNENFLALQSQLEGTENRIAVERRRFNEAVREYNTRLGLFPGTIVARLAGFRPKAFFEAAPDAATPPKVKF